MNYALLKFISAIFFTSLAFIFVPPIAQEQGWMETVPTFSVEIVSTLTLLTLAVFYYLQKIQKADPHNFIQAYMLSITVKMVVGCALIVIIIFMDRDGAIANALLFILSYFSLTGIEISFLWKGRTTA